MIIDVHAHALDEAFLHDTDRLLVRLLATDGRATLAALAVRAIVLRGLERWLGRERPSLVVAAVRLPSILWCLVLGFYVGIEAADFPRPLIDKLNLAHWLHVVRQARRVPGVDDHMLPA